MDISATSYDYKPMILLSILTSGFSVLHDCVFKNILELKPTFITDQKYWLQI